MNAEPEYRAMMAVDVQGSGTRGNMPQLEMREILSAALAEAFDRSGIDLASCRYDDLGDGARVIIPSATPKYHLIHPVTDELAACLRRANDRADAGEPMKLRAALHAGDVYLNHERGIAGTSLVVLARLLDSAAIREALRASSLTDPVAVIISQHFYEETVPHKYPGIDALAFRKVRVHEKEYSADAWLYVPGGSLPLGEDPSPGDPDIAVATRRANRRPWILVRRPARSGRVTQHIENSTIGGSSVVIGYQNEQSRGSAAGGGSRSAAREEAEREVSQLIQGVQIGGDSTMIGEAITGSEPQEEA